MHYVVLVALTILGPVAVGCSATFISQQLKRVIS